MKTIPIKKAKEICKELGLEQVIIVGIKGTWSSVATYGKTYKDCEQAAIGGNLIKKNLLGWPESDCNAKPRRVRNKEKKEESKDLTLVIPYEKLNTKPYIPPDDY